jgi:hypothetical protein
MAKETLIVELDARTAKLEKALKDVNNKLDKTEKKTTKADKSLKEMGETAAKVGSKLKVAAVAGLALATALTAVVLKSASSQRELSLLSKQAKLSTDDFEALAFATKQYGINAEQIADISKDLSDKMGEFGKVGTGAFQDFADIIGLTKEQAMQAAREFENMSSDQVIGKMVSQMEAAGASGNEMVFVLESMGNDLSRLIPLFTNNSKELKTLTSTYSAATKAMKLTSTEMDGLNVAATSFDLMTDSLVKGGNLISAQIAPLLSEFFNSVIEVVPEATQAVVNFINAFKTPAEITNLASIQSQLKDATRDLTIASLELAKIEGEGLESGVQGSRIYQNILKKRKDAVEGLVVNIKELTEREAELTAQRVADAKRLTGGTISASGITGGGGGTGDEIQAIADRFKTEEELLKQKLDADLLIIGENNELKLLLEQEYQEGLAGIKQNAAEADAQRESSLSDLFKDISDSDADEIDKKNSKKEKSDLDYFGAANTIGNALFENSKLVSSGLAAMNTYEGITKALAQQNWVAAAATAVAGAAQIVKINSTEKGGGGGGGVASVGAQPTEPEQTTELSISDTDVSGASQSQNITISIESGDDDLAVALSGILSKAKVNGAIT